MTGPPRNRPRRNPGQASTSAPGCAFAWPGDDNRLQELLYIFETEGLIFGQFQVKLHESSLEATAWGEPFDPNVHTMKTEIKAVTYHQLEVVKTDHGWQAQVIFDI